MVDPDPDFSPGDSLVKDAKVDLVVFDWWYFLTIRLSISFGGQQSYKVF